MLSRSVSVKAAALCACAVVAWQVVKQQSRQPKRRRASRDGHRRVLLIVTGSVAAVKAADLIESLMCCHGLHVDLVLTHSGDFFQTILYKGKRGIDRLAVLEQQQAEDGSKMLQVSY